MRIEQERNVATSTTIITMTLSDADLVALPSDDAWWIQIHWDAIVDTFKKAQDK